MMELHLQIWTIHVFEFEWQSVFRIKVYQDSLGLVSHNSRAKQSQVTSPRFAESENLSHCRFSDVSRDPTGRMSDVCLDRGKSAAKRTNLDWETVKSGVLTQCDWRGSKQYNQLYKVVAPIGQSGSVSYFLFVFHPWTNLESTNQSDQPHRLFASNIQFENQCFVQYLAMMANLGILKNCRHHHFT
jgi:hypothetical protein